MDNYRSDPCKTFKFQTQPRNKDKLKSIFVYTRK